MLRFSLVLATTVALLAGCAKPPQSTATLTAYAAGTDPVVTSAVIDRPSAAPAYQAMPKMQNGTLAGRVLTVSNNAQLVLRPGEVVLTFDDGPRPGKTETILDTLDRYGVKATFLMLGYAAQRHPGLVQDVARRGHTIGTHTFDHVNLASLNHADALAEIRAGQLAVAQALAMINREPSRFFRFPYLAQTGLIRASAMDSNFIILDVDVDSKDYYKSSPREVMERTLARLDAKGQGIILFHDIHARTVAMLPEFLGALQERGYTVVTLRSTGGGTFDTPLVTAGAPATTAPL